MNQPVQPMQQPAQPMHHMNQPQQPMGRKSRGWLAWTVLAVVVIVILAVIGIVFRSKLFPSKNSADALSGYQAIFLTNGQVYFGKLTNSNDQYVHLTDIYYLQVNNADGTAASTTATAANSTAASAATQLSLVKLGNELHGPADEMQINRDQILFYEDLKANGQVAQAIQQYQKSGGTAGAANSTPAQGTTQAPANSSNSVIPTGSGTSTGTSTSNGAGTGTQVTPGTTTGTGAGR